MYILKKILQIQNVFMALALVLMSCASMDDYLEIAIDQTVPTVIFEEDVLEDSDDTLLLLAMQDASVFKGTSYTSLTFYLKNTNGGFGIMDSKDSPARFLQFTEVTGDNLMYLSRDLPQLEGMEVFALYLKGMTVNKDGLNTYKILSDGDFRGISFTSERLIKDRRIDFFMKDSDMPKAIYRKFASEVYKPAF